MPSPWLSRTLTPLPVWADLDADARRAKVAALIAERDIRRGGRAHLGGPRGQGRERVEDSDVIEQVEAFEAMVKWERDGIKPSGDDVVTAAEADCIVAASEHFGYREEAPGIATPPTVRVAMASARARARSASSGSPRSSGAAVCS